MPSFRATNDQTGQVIEYSEPVAQMARLLHWFDPGHCERSIERGEYGTATQG